MYEGSNIDVVIGLVPRNLERRLLLGGMLGAAPCSSIGSRGAVGSVGLIRLHDGARAKMVKQWVGDLPVMRLSGRQAAPDREALRVDNDMDLGREPAA